MAVTAQLEAVLRRREAFSQQRPATLEELRVSFEQRMSEFPGEPDVRYAPVDAGGVPAEWIVAPGRWNSGCCSSCTVAPTSSARSRPTAT